MADARASWKFSSHVIYDMTLFHFPSLTADYCFYDPSSRRDNNQTFDAAALTQLRKPSSTSSLPAIDASFLISCTLCSSMCFASRNQAANLNVHSAFNSEDVHKDYSTIGI